MSRVDYSISDNTKLFVRYNMQRETQKFPIGLWWRNGNQVPYPDAGPRKEQVGFSYRKPDSRVQPDDDERVHLRLHIHRVPERVRGSRQSGPDEARSYFWGVFNNNVVQIPSFTATGELAAMVNPGGFEVGGNRGLFADKHLPSIQDNLSKVWGTHTVKGGFYWEYIINNQPANGFTNGQLGFDVANPPDRPAVRMRICCWAASTTTRNRVSTD